MLTLSKTNILGKGEFSTVYDLGSEVGIISRDPIKGAYSDNHEISLFPELEYIEAVDHIFRAYKMEKMEKVTAPKKQLSAPDYKIYKTLRDLMQDCAGQLPRNIFDLYSFWYKKFNTIQDENLRDIMLEMIDHLADYTECMSFEISPRNIAIKNGKLVLLDVFFCVRELRKGRGINNHNTSEVLERKISYTTRANKADFTF